MPRLKVLTAALAILAAIGLSAGRAEETMMTEAERLEAFEAWKSEFKMQAAGEGIQPALYDEVMRSVVPIKRVVELNDDQPEFVRALWDYLDSALSDRRISDGKANYAANKPLLESVAAKYGVAPEVIVAIWGLESAYGKIQGDFDTISALATLAFDGRRTSFGRAQLIAAMKIIQSGHATRSELKGSWAGAMGQTQFIPTTYLAHAVDENGDGKIDIWNHQGDVFASTANYLTHSGWRADRRWGIEAKLPAGFDYTLADRSTQRAAVEWAAAGVTAGDGSSLLESVDPNAHGYLLVPAGAKGPAFFIFPNFHVILRYNNATSYALAVGMLSDAIAGRSVGVHQPWPRDERPLSRSESLMLQERLRDNGFDPGGIDGLIGPATRKALRDWQQSKGLIPDGFASASVLEMLGQE